MQLASQRRLLSLMILLLALNIPYSYAILNYENKIKTAVFLSPKFVLGPGSVVNKYFFNIEFPRGHVAIKSFNGEIVDEARNPVPLYETYLQHWAVGKYHQHKNARYREYDGHQVLHQSGHIVRNNGLCQGDVNGQYFGIGSETRRTDTHIPDPYKLGNPAEIRSGFEEKWLLNVHAIDTRGVEDKMGCTECRRDLYNVTQDENGQLLRPEYKGGLKCCYDSTQCRKREGFEGPRRGLYLSQVVHQGRVQNMIARMNNMLNLVVQLAWMVMVVAALMSRGQAPDCHLVVMSSMVLLISIQAQLVQPFMARMGGLYAILCQYMEKELKQEIWLATF
ncbi:Stress up-regulated Nod 19 protein [Quillaja saponaria]|uniref:Stress up-regulated Nod 19 protein n=1 Tax=Quillaja saponaria TaxID=32244 RepID=A0AAD7PDA6_QUISA|nr:Stress up-regulated Nod 19 protein [Quillaja saponaria]